MRPAGCCVVQRRPHRPMLHASVDKLHRLQCRIHVHRLVMLPRPAGKTGPGFMRALGVWEAVCDRVATDLQTRHVDLKTRQIAAGHTLCCPVKQIFCHKSQQPSLFSTEHSVGLPTAGATVGQQALVVPDAYIRNTPGET
eukprot:CAMPEP_0204445576 /NCGR_PEP_ID=MMETSP0470-20130426/93130_1 /ASSEMBLY_ACC=CAM_ASM_000385 /TAXON_ID=2969 /ORGANISM="Oxyrrhis marina" /LENGTH=139 /DNA_ID=CAMNT_0051445047 /DNA_START=379 /DNA_END=798 /DNA_ORIENTATION=+